MSTKIQCPVCYKEYSSQSSLCNHKKRIHIGINVPKVQKINNLGQNDELLVQNINNLGQSEALESCSNNTCKYCFKKLSCYKSLQRHISICKAKNNLIKENQELKTEINTLKDESSNTKKELEILKDQIKDLLNTRNKIHPKTLQKMINNTNTNSHNTTNTNNGTINNVNIISLGREDIPALFNTNEELEVLNKKNNALYHLIEKVHFNDSYPQFKNIFITNNRKNEAHLYDINSNKFKIVDKDEAINDIIEYRVCDIEEFYQELGNKLDQKAKDILEELFRERGDDNITRDKVKLLIYNNKK
jgi:hypothetical protein